MAGRVSTSNLEVPDTPVILDETAILAGFEGDVALMHETVQLLMTDLPERMTQARAAFGTGDLGELAEAAHAIKGAIGYFALHEASEAVRHLEASARAGRLDQAETDLAVLERELGRVEPALRSLLPRAH
jgi:two-component system sensor histidine kinase/response regulator